MRSVILIDPDANALVTQRVRLRDRLRARFRSFVLDEAIAAGIAPDSDAALTLRAQRLIGEETRCQLGLALRRASARSGSGPSLSRISACSQVADDAEELIARLALRLLAPTPVEARGVAQARLLLSDATSPLFWSRRSAQSSERVQRTLAALEPKPVEESV
jgi:hypothetical protein